MYDFMTAVRLLFYLDLHTRSSLRTLMLLTLQRKEFKEKHLIKRKIVFGFVASGPETPTKTIILAFNQHASMFDGRSIVRSFMERSVRFTSCVYYNDDKVERRIVFEVVKVNQKRALAYFLIVGDTMVLFFFFE